VIAVLGVLPGCYGSIVGFGKTVMPARMENIKLGLDLEGGVSITYQVKGDDNPSDEDMSGYDL
jgi:SecD/SecF fusion protein